MILKDFREARLTDSSGSPVEIDEEEGQSTSQGGRGSRRGGCWRSSSANLQVKVPQRLREEREGERRGERGVRWQTLQGQHLFSRHSTLLPSVLVGQTPKAP